MVGMPRAHVHVAHVGHKIRVAPNTHTVLQNFFLANLEFGNHSNLTLKLLLSCKCVASLVEARCKFQGGQTHK